MYTELVSGPHGPTLLSNGPSSVEIQVRWIRDAINKIRRQDLKYINPTKEASDAWKKRINDLAAPTLFPTTRSTYMGGVRTYQMKKLCGLHPANWFFSDCPGQSLRDDLL